MKFGGSATLTEGLAEPVRPDFTEGLAEPFGSVVHYHELIDVFRRQHNTFIFLLEVNCNHFCQYVKPLELDFSTYWNIDRFSQSRITSL